MAVALAGLARILLMTNHANDVSIIALSIFNSCLRQFMLLENVSRILSKDMRDIMTFLLEELLCELAVFNALLITRSCSSGGEEKGVAHSLGHLDRSRCGRAGLGLIVNCECACWNCFACQISATASPSSNQNSGMAPKNILLCPSTRLSSFPGLGINSFVMSANGFSSQFCYFGMIWYVKIIEPSNHRSN